MASAAATLAVAGAALRLANPCGISGEAKPVAQGLNPSDAVVRKERFIVRPIDRDGRIVGRTILDPLAVDIEVN
jgi:hypothetical protein